MSPVSDKQLFLSKSVEDLSIAGDQPPPEYIVKGCSYAPAYISSCSSTSFPIIDISLFSQSSPADDDGEAQALNILRSALTSSGCFQAVGHGMSSSFLDKVREIAYEFFDLPIEEKQKYGRAPNESEGYGSDVVVTENQVLDWSHRLSLRVFPQHQRRFNLWPQQPTDFRRLTKKKKSERWRRNERSLRFLLHKSSIPSSLLKSIPLIPRITQQQTEREDASQSLLSRKTNHLSPVNQLAPARKTNQLAPVRKTK